MIVNRFWLASVFFLVAAASLPAAASGQGVELDRVVSRVGGRIITQTDIDRARELRLVDDTSSDEAIRVALENRLLILAEINRGQGLPPVSSEALAAHRMEWTRSLGDGADLPALMRRTGATQSMLDSWQQDDLRIRAFLDRQFGQLPDGDRDRVIADWIGRLRQRAGL